MNNRKMSCGLVAFYVAAIFLVGCVPEDSLEWSEDGSVGLLRVEGGLYLVDGQSGELTEIEKDDVLLWPDISDDGSLVAYSKKFEYSDTSEGLKTLPPGQVKMVKYYAEQIRKNILKSGGLTNGEFPFPDKGLLTPDEYRNWAIRYVCENADSKLLEILGEKGIEKVKEKEIICSRIIVVPSKDPEKKRIVATSIFPATAMQLSPNGKFLAYLMHTQEGEVSNAFEEYGLYVASLKTDIKAMHVDSRVAVGYDWREDGKAIAYISADSDNLLHDDFLVGTLEERTIADANDNLLAIPTEVPEQGSAGTHKCTGKTSELAGVIFYSWLKVVYGPGNRLFFTSAVLTLPASRKDVAEWSLFCYDSVTDTVTDVLAGVSNYTSEAMNMQFALSPDGKIVLLPIKHNRFIRYELGTDSMEIPIKEDEGFGEENVSAFLPAWKGNDEISCPVSEKSRFLNKEGEDKHHRKEIVILGADGKFRRVLSENWPDLLDK